MRQNLSSLSIQTASFVEALDLVLQAEDKIIGGLSEMYGDFIEMYGNTEISSRIEETKRAIREQIGFAMELNIGEHKEKL